MLIIKIIKHLLFNAYGIGTDFFQSPINTEAS